MQKSINQILVLSIFFIMVMGTGLYAQKTQSNSDRVSVYNFNFLQSQTVNKTRKKFTKSRKYYSFIIPQSLFKILSKKYGHEVIRNLNSPELTEKDKSIGKKLRKIGKDNNVSFLVTGSCTINRKRISIETTIWDTKGAEIRSFRETSNETGVILQGIIEKIAKKINSHLSEIKKINKKRFSPSPIEPFFNKNITLGIKTAYTWPLGFYKDIYDSTYLITPEIGYKIGQTVKLVMAFDYWKTDPNKISPSATRNFYYRAATLGLDFNFPLGKHFNFNLGISGGVAHSNITVLQYSGALNSQEEKSMDPYLSATLGLDLKLNESLALKTGGVFRNIFYKDENFYMMGYYLGLEVAF